MSLNGLDDPKIKEAHTTAVAEPGGWFLLKYIARDEVDLLGRGNGGIVEIRNAIANYEEASPLFGFLRYRRRNVLIKYMPEECSRLVQARVTVHFNAVTEHFSPHDTVFPITTSKELRDTTLSAACSLHTASGSTSSSTSSLRRRRLMEIAEEEEEEIRAKRQSTVPEERPSTAKAHSISGSQPGSAQEPPLPTNLPPPITLSTDPTSLSPPREHRSSESESPTRSIGESRRSMQSTRLDTYAHSTYGSSGRPKVKLGPRPSLDRPHTSAASSFYRPVSTLPAGLKIFSKGSKKEKTRPQSQIISEPPTISLPAPPEPPTNMSEYTPTRPHTSGGRPTTSSGVSMRGPLNSPALSMAPRMPGMTPERARLMKAQELRRKKIAAAKAAEEESAKASEETTKENAQVNTSLAESPESPMETQPTLAMLNDIVTAEDSGIAFDPKSPLKSDESDATRSDSYPVSPVGASERAESTTASSVSESTDETIQEQKHLSTLHYDPTAEKHNEREVGDEERVELTSSDSELPRLLPVVYNPFENSSLEPETQTSVNSSAQREVAEPIVPAIDEKAMIPTTSVMDVDVVTPAEDILVAAEHVQTHSALEGIPQLQLPKTPKEWNIPRSKFSVQNLKESSSVNEEPTEPRFVHSNRSETPLPQKSPVESTFSIDTRQSIFEDGTESGASSFKRNKRKGRIDPIRTDLDSEDRSGANSDDNFSSDDDLMDELQSAVFQEAKPISVSKSPISPVFPSPMKAKGGELNRISRAVTTPMRTSSPDSQLLELPSSSHSHSESIRSTSASATYLNRVNSQTVKPMAKKANLGSGISQRIKALEKFSSLSPDQNANLGTTAGTPTFFSVRKTSSVRVPSKSPSIAERANSLTGNTPSPSISRESTPENGKPRDRSPSIQNRVDALKSNPTNQAARSRPESVSVTARIVRDPSQPFLPRSDTGKDPLDYAPLDLKQSPLVIDHQRAVDAPKETILERRLSKDRPLSISSNTTKKERRSSVTIIKDLINDRRTSFSEHRKSLTLERPAQSSQVMSPSRPPSTHMTKGHQRQVSTKSSSSRGESGNVLSSPASATLLPDDKSDKKSNRASRMLHRMSAALSPGRKNFTQAISPTLQEESEPFSGDIETVHSQHPSSTPTSICIGDVNVQFPDTLLWKRRTMFLDTQGYLIMAPALTAHANGKDKTSVGSTRRFHLSEFRTPSIPDVEIQELPNSVVLDFLEGGELQVACEDKAGQAEILSILQEAHRNWNGQ